MDHKGLVGKIAAKIEARKSRQDLEFKYQAAQKAAEQFSDSARDPFTHEVANYYHREAAKYAMLLRMVDLAHHHNGKSGYHAKSSIFRVKK